MNVLINSAITAIANGSTYKSFKIACENKSATITVVSGKVNYVNVTVNNASHKAFGGLGKNFENFDQAINNYKDSKIKAIIEAAKLEA